MNRYIAAFVTVFAAALLSPVFASTGPFTGPLLNPWLSVDLNGGVASGTGQTTSPTEGWNGSFPSPSFSADQYGVTWSAWGGNAGAYGDGTQLPSSQSSPNVNASSISKTFGSYTATLSINTAVNSAYYGQVNSTASMNSRDRNAPASTYSPAALSDTDMFRDLVFASAAGTAIQGNNYLTLQLSGLNAGGWHRVALYSYDSTGAHSMNWTAIAPTVNGNSRAGWWDGTADNIFTAPSDEQTIT